MPSLVRFVAPGAHTSQTQCVYPCHNCPVSVNQYRLSYGCHLNWVGILSATHCFPSLVALISSIICSSASYFSPYYVRQSFSSIRSKINLAIDALFHAIGSSNVRPSFSLGWVSLSSFNHRRSAANYPHSIWIKYLQKALNLFKNTSRK